MGYSTDFNGSFQIEPPLSPAEVDYLKKFAETRRMKRVGLPPEYGIDGEFYTDDETTGVTDYNTPPRTQPGLWCQWVPTDDGTALEWDQGEKFYYYKEWLKYIIENFMTPKGHTLSGQVRWFGESDDDRGAIKAEGGRVLIAYGKTTYDVFEEL